MCVSRPVASNLTSPLQQRMSVPSAFTPFFFSTLSLSPLTTATTLTTNRSTCVFNILHSSLNGNRIRRRRIVSFTAATIRIVILLCKKLNNMKEIIIHKKINVNFYQSLTPFVEDKIGRFFFSPQIGRSLRSK